MKEKFLYVMGILLVLAFASNCKSISKTNMADGKTAVVVNKWGITFFTAGGAPAIDCVGMLATEGIKGDDVKSVTGGGEGVGISLNRVGSNAEGCTALGIKN